MASVWTRTGCAAAMIVTVVASAGAQEIASGARRVEWCGFPTGALVFAHPDAGLPEFTNYTLGTALAWNVTERMGVEAEAGFGVGWVRSAIVRGQLLKQPMPDSAAYSASILVSPLGTRRAVAPYVAGGVGAFSLLPHDGTDAVGVAARQTMLTGNAGGGIKWYSSNGWGVRADYRLFVLDHHDEALPLFGEPGARLGHRFYAGLFTTF